MLGRAWSTSLNLNFGQYANTYSFSLSDPWIKGDKHKTAFRTNVFLSRDYPQESELRTILLKEKYLQ